MGSRSTTSSAATSCNGCRTCDDSTGARLLLRAVVTLLLYGNSRRGDHLGSAFLVVTFLLLQLLLLEVLRDLGIAEAYLSLLLDCGGWFRNGHRDATQRWMILQ